MAADLARTPSSGIEVQLCGDAHLSNFGGYGSPDRTLVFDLNDFDETLKGPWEWDVKRLVTSVEIAGRDRGFEEGRRREIAQGAATAYRRAMRQFADQSTLEVWYSRMTMDDVRGRWGREVGKDARRNFDRAIAKATKKDSARAAARLVSVRGGKARFRSEPPIMVPLSELTGSAEETSTVAAIQEALEDYRSSLVSERRHLFDQFQYVDAARRVSGVGSVGRRTWVVLMSDCSGSPLVLQIKEAGPSALAPYVGPSVAGSEGDRVVSGQRLLQGSSDIFLGTLNVAGLDGVERDFYVRQLWDWKLSPDLSRHDETTLGIYAQMCGWTLARGHARSGDRIAIAAYLGNRDTFDVAMADFARDYADQNDHDYERFVAHAADRPALVAGA